MRNTNALNSCCSTFVSFKKEEQHKKEHHKCECHFHIEEKRCDRCRRRRNRCERQEGFYGREASFYDNY